MAKRKVPYFSTERRIVGYRPGAVNTPDLPIYNTIVNPRENFRAMYYDKDPYWTGRADSISTMPDLYHDTLGRPRYDYTDVFGRFWEWVPSANGSITPHGQPLFTDVNEWRDHITFPNIDEWDWAGAAEKTPMDTRFAQVPSFWNGFWFERMVSWMDFMPAAEALIDEDQHAAILDLLGTTTEFACKVIDKFIEYFPCIDGINMHDDWGSQAAPFFSDAVAKKLFLPAMKQMVDHIHSRGRIASLHSCGRVESRINIFIEAGFDDWTPQPMNDSPKLYEEFGDKIILGIFTDSLPAGSSDADYKEAARNWVKRFCKPGKPSMVGNIAMRDNPVFAEELYEYSRKHYAGLL